MSPEWQAPEPDEIYSGMIKAGRTPYEFFMALKMVEDGMNRGEIRTEISCWENIRSFFNMADRMYVKNLGMDMKDAEIGIHLAGCACPLCQKLGKVYFEELRTSKESDSVKMRKRLENLAQELILGKERKDLNGRKSKYYDSQTGANLYETKVVDITDKVTGSHKGRRVLLSYVPYSGGVLCDVQDGALSQAFNITDDLKEGTTAAFEHRADVTGIDSELFRVIVLANAPRTKLLKRKV